MLDVVQARLDRAPEAAQLRRQTVEHVFGTLKAWMGPNHFLTRTLPKVRAEMEPAGAGLQHEAGDQHSGRQAIDQGDGRIGGAQGSKR